MNKLFNWLLLTCLLGASLAAGPIHAQTALRPIGKVPIALVGRSAKPYLEIGSQPVAIPLAGPGRITGYARAVLPVEDPAPVRGTLFVAGIPGLPGSQAFEFKASARSAWAEERSGIPSGGRKLTLDIPEGTHTLELTADVAGGNSMLVLLYYEGPDQPKVPGLMVTAPSGKPKKQKKAPPWDFRGNAGIDIMYNDNILTDSPDYQSDFVSGTYPWKFLIDSKDDMVISPSVDLEARKQFISWGQTRFRFKVKRFMYAKNPIKTNTDFHFYIRQYLRKSTSIEGYFHFAPEQYIRQLSDRIPGEDREDPIEWKEFRFQRNVWNVTARHSFSKKVSALLLYEHNYRYYNQPFMENDITAWEVRGNVGWIINKTFKLSGDYSFEDASARAADELDEDPETSNNSDASYERDLYRIGLRIRPSPLKKAIKEMNLSFLFMDYYYTTDKTIVDDPYHAGRNDRYYKATVEVRRKLAKPLTLKFAVRRTQRVVHSPWEGDITTDKDFSQWLVWFNLTYRF